MTSPLDDDWSPPWFGDPWPSTELRAPVCEDDSRRVDTPIGSDCLLCSEAIAEGDRGLINPHPNHIECLLYNVFHDCAIDHPGEGETLRQAALRAWERTH